MYRMEGFYPQSFYFRDTKNFLILPVDSVGPSNSTCICNWVQKQGYLLPCRSSQKLLAHCATGKERPEQNSCGATIPGGQGKLGPAQDEPRSYSGFGHCVLCPNIAALCSMVLGFTWRSCSPLCQ